MLIPAKTTHKGRARGGVAKVDRRQSGLAGERFAMSKWARTVMIGLLGAFALLYAVALAALYVGERKLLYFPNAVEVAPASVGLPNAERLHLTTGDGERLLAWYIAPAAGKPLILYFHGNGGRARSARRAFQRLRGGGRWAAG